MCVPQGFDLKCVFVWCFCFLLKLKGAVIQCVTQHPAWLKWFWFLITQWLIVLHSGLPRCHVYPPVPISSGCVSTHAGGVRQSKETQTKILNFSFPIAHPWNVARCRMMLKSQAKVEMWRYLWFWIIYLPVLLIHWWVSILYIWYLAFPHSIIIFKMDLYSSVLLQRSYFCWYTYFSTNQ